VQTGEVADVQISLDANNLAYWNEGSHSFEIEECVLEITAGGSSEYVGAVASLRMRQ